MFKASKGKKNRVLAQGTDIQKIINKFGGNVTIDKFHEGN